MRHFTNVKDLGDLNIALKEAFEVKANRFGYKELGKNKTLIMIFFSISIRGHGSLRPSGEWLWTVIRPNICSKLFL